MATLLHIDTSVNPDGVSVSRSVTASFREAWEAQHPDGKVIYRDLNADPIPHLQGLAAAAGFIPPQNHTAEQAAAFALRDQLATEFEQADSVLIGAPMYNYTIPSTLKAWLDHVIIMGRTTGSENRTAAGKPATVVASRGGGYGPGTKSSGVSMPAAPSGKEMRATHWLYFLIISLAPLSPLRLASSENSPRLKRAGTPSVPAYSEATIG